MDRQYWAEGEQACAEQKVRATWTRGRDRQKHKSIYNTVLPNIFTVGGLGSYRHSLQWTTLTAHSRQTELTMCEPCKSSEKSEMEINVWSQASSEHCKPIRACRVISKASSGA